MYVCTEKNWKSINVVKIKNIIMKADMILYYAAGSIVILIIYISFTRWLFRIDEIKRHLHQQTKLLAEIAKKQDVSISIINEILNPNEIEKK